MSHSDLSAVFLAIKMWQIGGCTVLAEWKQTFIKIIWGPSLRLSKIRKTSMGHGQSWPHFEEIMFKNKNHWRQRTRSDKFSKKDMFDIKLASFGFRWLQTKFKVFHHSFQNVRILYLKTQRRMSTLLCLPNRRVQVCCLGSRLSVIFWVLHL